MLFLIGILFALGSVQTASVDGAIDESYKSYKDHRVYSVSGDRKSLVDFAKFLNEFELSLGPQMVGSFIVDDYKKHLEIMVAPAVLNTYLDAVEAQQLNSSLICDDFSKIISLEKGDFRRSEEFSWTAYHDIDVINQFLTNMSNAYPDQAELVVGGRSYHGRQILGLRIVTPTKNADVKPAVIIESGIHAREWIAPATTTYFINELLTSQDPKLQNLRDAFDWHIFPSVNPDGYQYSRKVVAWKRCKGDETAYAVGASDDPCDYQLYAGRKPFSEIETLSFARYIDDVDNLLGYVGFHSYGELLLLPFSDSTEHVNNYDDLVAIGKMSLEYGQRASKLPPYTPPATAAEILYKAAGGSMDWVRATYGTPLVFTYELRGYQFHWDPKRIPEQGVEVTQMLLGLFTAARDLGYY